MPLDGPLDLVPQWKTLKKPAGAQLNTNQEAQPSSPLQPVQSYHQSAFRPHPHQQLRPSQSQRDYHTSSPFADFNSPASGPGLHGSRHGSSSRAPGRWLDSSNSSMQRGPSLQADTNLSSRDRTLSLPQSSSANHAVAAKGVFNADFPSLQYTAHPSSHATPRATNVQPSTPVTPSAPKPTPYSFLADRVSTNWTSKLAIAPNPPPAVAPAVDAAVDDTPSTPSTNHPAPAPPPAPTLASAPSQPGWGAASGADGLQRPRLIDALVHGGADSNSGREGAGHSMDPEAFRAQLAVRQSKQLIPVIARKGDTGAGATAKPTTSGSAMLRQTASFKQQGSNSMVPGDGKLLLRLPSAAAAHQQSEERLKHLGTPVANNVGSGMVPLLKSPSRRATTSPDPAAKLVPIKISTISDRGMAFRTSAPGGSHAAAELSAEETVKSQDSSPHASSPQQGAPGMSLSSARSMSQDGSVLTGKAHGLPQVTESPKQPSMRAVSTPGTQQPTTNSSTSPTTNNLSALTRPEKACKPSADAWGDEDEAAAGSSAGAGDAAAAATAQASSCGDGSWDGSGETGSPMLKDGSTGSSSTQQSSSTSSIDGTANLASLQTPTAAADGKLPPSSWEDADAGREAELVLPPEEEAFLRALGWTDSEADGDEQSCQLTEEEIAAFKAAAAAMAHSSSRCTTPHIDQTPIQSRTTSPLPYLSWSGLPVGSSTDRISVVQCGSSFEGVTPSCAPEDTGSPHVQDACEVIFIEPLFPGVSKGWFAGTFAQ